MKLTMCKQRIISLFSLLLTAVTLMAQHQNDIVDITSKFTHCWNEAESIERNSDGSITFHAQKWGGLVYWVDGDWSAYSQLVFELAEPSPCAVQPLVLYPNGASSDSHYMGAGTTKAYVDLSAEKRSHVNQVALQTSEPATIVISRIYLVKEQLPDYGEQKGQLCINELMQSNIDCIMDDLNEFPDSWVELYNSGTTPVNLGKYKLGLTADAASAWQLPTRTINAGEHVLVYCDKEGKGLHTSFRLDSGKGAAVYLFFNGEVDGQVTDLKKQPAPNIAYGRETDAGSTWGYQYQPTPGTANSGQLCSKILDEPVFSTKGCVIVDNHPVSLSLSLPSGSPEGAVIRYTTDSSEPTANSQQYTAPIDIHATATIRAKLFCDGYLSPRSTTHSYVYMSHVPTLPVISLVTDDRYWNDPQIGILVNNSSSNKNDWRRPVNLEYFEGVGSKSKLNQLCETRVQGGGSRNNKLKSLAVYANKRFGTKRLKYEFFPDQRPGVTDFKSISLRDAGNDYPYLYLRDPVIQRTMASHVDLDWQAWRPAIVFKNGVYKGMLNIRERSNEDNIYTNYDGLEDIDMFENWEELKEGDWVNHDQFKAFYHEEGHTMAEYEQWMDCKEFANLMLMHIYYNNRDFPGNNIVMWRPRTDTGRWRFIAKDADFGLGLYGTSPDFNTIEWLYDPDYDPNCAWANRPEHTMLFRHLMEDVNFRRLFTNLAAVYMGDFLNERGTRAFLDAMFDQIKDEMVYHQQVNDRWVDFKKEYDNVVNWLTQRTSSFYQQLSDHYQLGVPVPLTVNLQVDDADLEGVTITMNDIPLSEGRFDGQYFDFNMLTIKGVSNNGKTVSGWEVVQHRTDGTETTTVANGKQYFCMMPKCQLLTINAIIDTSGITENGANRDWTWRVDGNLLTVAQLTAGTSVRLYDLRGVLLHDAVTDGSEMNIPLTGHHSACLLKVGQDCVKIYR